MIGLGYKSILTININDMKLQDFKIKTITGEDLDLAKLNGKVLLLVNVASKCGLTPQYKLLEMLYRKNKELGLEIIGFPCNQFGAQEPGSPEEIVEFCQNSFGVTFTLTEKIDVKGDNQHPIFKWLVENNPNVNDVDACMSWNFTKFLIDREGKIVARFAPKGNPMEFMKVTEDLVKA